MTAPCRGCPDRDYPHCHMVCPKYAAYRAECDAIRDAKATRAAVLSVRDERFQKFEHDRIMHRKRRGK